MRGGDYVHQIKNEKGGYVRVEWGGGYCPTPNYSNTILPVLELAGWLQGLSWLMCGSRKCFLRGSNIFFLMLIMGERI